MLEHANTYRRQLKKVGPDGEQVSAAVLHRWCLIKKETAIQGFPD
jgi:hypothetical protein